MADIEISFDPLRIDFVKAAQLLSETHWGKGRGEGDQLKAFGNSLCAGAFVEGRQIGFGRAITDRTFFAYLCDVIVWPEDRGQGAATRMVQAFLEHPELASVVHFSLYTATAHGIYARLGFARSGDGNYMRLERRPGR
jgi:GNAT superfamily N-acetyltransferase